MYLGLPEKLDDKVEDYDTVSEGRTNGVDQSNPGTWSELFDQNDQS